MHYDVRFCVQVREPPAMAAAWAERMVTICRGRQPEAALKMLTVLHRLQASKRMKPFVQLFFTVMDLAHN